MLRGVQDCTPVFRREWVDSRRNPGLCRSTSTPGRPVAGVILERGIQCRPFPALPADARHFRPWAMRFEKYLEKRNREVPEVVPVSISPVHRLPDPARARLDVPRLGDVTPVEQTTVERRIRAVYRIDIPLRAGRVLDILV